MGLESGTRIPELDPANPTSVDPVSQGDDHLKLLKVCIQGSFPDLELGQYTGTADELNKINGDLVNSFNNRTGDVVPLAGDYSATNITYDNTASGLTAERVQAAIDEIVAMPSAEVWTANGYTGVNAGLVEVTSHDPANSYATVVNTAAGLVITATQDCAASVNYSYSFNNSFTSRYLTCDVRRDGAVVSVPQQAYFANEPAQTSLRTGLFSAAIKLNAGQALTFGWAETGGALSDRELDINVLFQG
jgi:hypothetical protein